MGRPKGTKNVMRTPEEKERIAREAIEDDVASLIKEYVDYYNNERPMCCLGYKTPRQYRTDMGY